jgi:hypothetical protein
MRKPASGDGLPFRERGSWTKLHPFFQYFMFVRSSIKPGPVGSQPRVLRVHSLEAGMSKLAKPPSQPKCSAGGSMRLIEGSRSLIHSTFSATVERAIASGDLRADTESNDFVRALVGVFHTTALPGWEQSARRLVDILIAGSRSTTPVQ